MPTRPGMRPRTCALLLCALVAAMPVSAIDLSGVYVSEIDLFSTPCTLTFAQSGSALMIDGPCTFGTTTYMFDLEGTVEPTTGAFSVSGVLIGLCEDPGEVTVTGSGDGEVFTAVSSCLSVATALTGTKCGNGVIDTTETCEDGNTDPGDCCSPTCLLDAAGTACPADTNACTLDQCDGAGQCLHPPNPAAARMPCASDANGCTDDECNDVGQCTHPANSLPCDDSNACSTPDVCAGGTCVGGPIVPDCVGTLDLTGDWTVLPVLEGLFASSLVRHFVQNGAVLESSEPGSTVGVGSVNPATRALEAYTPVVVLASQCMEVIVAFASLDGQSFEGQRFIGCPLEGVFGPFNVSGARCRADVGCFCAANVPCITADNRSRLMIRAKNGSLATRWQWVHSAMPTVFDNPVLRTTYHLCLDTADGGLLEVAPPGSSWNATRFGFSYASGTGAIRRILLEASPRKTSLVASLGPTSALTLPLPTPVRFRLIRESGGTTSCFESSFANPHTNTSTRFRAVQ